MQHFAVRADLYIDKLNVFHIIFSAFAKPKHTLMARGMSIRGLEFRTKISFMNDPSLKEGYVARSI